MITNMYPANTRLCLVTGLFKTATILGCHIFYIYDIFFQSVCKLIHNFERDYLQLRMAAYNWPQICSLFSAFLH